MAIDPVGAAIAVASIPAIFTSCVDCFKYTRTAHHIDRDVTTLHLKVLNLGVRLSRWGEAIRIDTYVFNDRAQERITRQYLEQIFRLFYDLGQRSKKYIDITKRQSEGSAAQHITGDWSYLALENQPREVLRRYATLGSILKKLTKREHKGKGYWKKFSWAVYDKEGLTRLATDASDLLNLLETHLPAPPDPIERLATRDVEELSNTRTVTPAELYDDDIVDLSGPDTQTLPLEGQWEPLQPTANGLEDHMPSDEALVARPVTEEEVTERLQILRPIAAEIDQALYNTVEMKYTDHIRKMKLKRVALHKGDHVASDFNFATVKDLPNGLPQASHSVGELDAEDSNIQIGTNYGGGHFWTMVGPLKRNG